MANAGEEGLSAKGKRRSEAKERYWGEKIQEGTRSDLSIREFCRQEVVTDAHALARLAVAFPESRR